MNYWRTKAHKELLGLQKALADCRHAGVEIGPAFLLLAGISDILDRGGKVKPERLELLAKLKDEKKKED